MSSPSLNRRIDLRSAFLGGLVAALVVSGFPAVAAEVGDALSLGESNRINARTILRGRAAANLIIISDAPRGSGAAALDLRVRDGNPPLKVNSAVVISNLNADHLDGRNAEDFAVESDLAALIARVDELEAVLSGVSRAGDGLSFPGDLALAGNLDVAGAGSVDGPVSLGRDVAVGGTLAVGVDATIGGDLALAGSLDVAGAGSVDGPVALGRDLAVGGSLEVGGEISAVGNVCAGRGPVCLL